MNKFILLLGKLLIVIGFIASGFIVECWQSGHNETVVHFFCQFDYPISTINQIAGFRFDRALMLFLSEPVLIIIGFALCAISKYKPTPLPEDEVDAARASCLGHFKLYWKWAMIAILGVLVIIYGVIGLWHLLLYFIREPDVFLIGIVIAFFLFIGFFVAHRDKFDL